MTTHAKATPPPCGEPGSAPESLSGLKGSHPTASGSPDGATHAKATYEEQLRAIIEAAVTDLCLLAEEIESHDLELAERIWSLANERLELPVTALRR